METTVTTLVNHKGEPVTVHNHDGANNAYVKDGHLFVEHTAMGTVAIYAPGSWVSAEISREA